MKSPDEILHDNAETYHNKTSDYGESWQAIGEIMYELTGGEPVTLETPEDFVSFGLFTRRLDKFARCVHGEFLKDEMNFESIQDSHEDESTYAAMHASLLDGQEPTTFENEHDADTAQLVIGDREPVGTIETIDAEITIDGVAEEDSIGYTPDEDDPQPGGPAITTEDEYDEALPVRDAYQEKYEELTGQE